MSLATPTEEREAGDLAEDPTARIDAVGSSEDRLPAVGTPKWSWLMVAIPLVVVLVGAWSYRWVQEDAFINFRIIGNLLAGHGPVFNVGERVEVYSDPLWMFLLAVTHEVVPFISLEWLSVLLGLGFTGLGVALSGRAMQRLGGRPPMASSSPSAYSSSRWYPASGSSPPPDWRWEWSSVGSD